MASGDISMDPDETTATANAWRQYADQIEQHGAVDPSVVEQLNTLGDIYAPYVEAKQRELSERAGAHQRVANHARLHASRLEATRQAFIEQDAAAAASLNKAVAD
jgi:hypothetical protein